MQHDDRPGVAIEVVDREPEPVEQQVTVRQAGERIVQMPVGELLLDLPPAGDVFDMDHVGGGLHKGTVPAERAAAPPRRS